MALDIQVGISRELKDDGSIVTAADRAVENYLREELPRLVPGTTVAGEEYGYTEAGPNGLWVVDPVDGTTNFSFGSPIWAVSIGLLQKNIPTMGAAYAPSLNEIYLAERGHGAFLNGKLLPPLRPGGIRPEEMVTYNENVARHVGVGRIPGKMRCAGSAVIDAAWVAAGRNRAMIGYNERLHDLAAVLVINHEVGADIRLLDGSPFEIEPLLHGEMIGKPWVIFPPNSDIVI
jgi:myo-inositol-1(or 4)-monophosphatase